MERNKITFEDFYRVMSHDVTEKTCIEIEFSIDDCFDYQNSWLGKMLDRETKKELYWYGLVEDGSQAYDFESFKEFSNAKIFSGKSIKEIWPLVSLLSIDACNIQERLPFYLDLSNNSK